MTIEEIRKGAPRTARFYDVDFYYYKLKGTWWQIFDCETKRWYGINKKPENLKPL